MNPTAPTSSAQSVEELLLDDSFKALTGTDTRDVGPILSSFVRLVGQASPLLRLGTLRHLTSWGAGHGFTLQRQPEGQFFQYFDSVCGWEDVCSELQEEVEDRANALEVVTEAGPPAFPNRNEISQLLNESKPVEWFAFRHGSSNTWTVHPKRHVIDREPIRKVCLLLFQADLILNNQQFPRSRIRASFENGRLWVWVNRKGDFLALLSSKGNSPGPSRQILQLGEAFRLT